MGTTVPEHVEGVAVFFGQDLEGDLLVGWGNFTVEIDGDAVHLGGDGRLGQPPADAFGDVAGRGSFLDLLNGAVGKSQGQHH